MNFLNFLFIFWFIFALLDPDPADQYSMRIRILNTDRVPWCRDLTNVMKANMLASKPQEKPSDVKREHPALQKT
jgi:hypothetical protein